MAMKFPSEHDMIINLRGEVGGGREGKEELELKPKEADEAKTAFADVGRISCGNDAFTQRFLFPRFTSVVCALVA